MSGVPRILILDDGELGEIADMLERLHVDHTRLRGGHVGEDLPPPTHLLITTPRRAMAVRPPGSKDRAPGEALRIIVVDEDSNEMRRMLRRMGFQLLVRRGAHPEVWRLLVERSLFQGDERRTDPRLPVGAPISLASFKESRAGDAATPARTSALLVDISNRGCRLAADEPLQPGARISLAIRLDDQGGDVLHLRGRLVRFSTLPPASDHGYSAAMLFDRDLPEPDRVLLTHLLNDLAVGPGSLSYGPAEALPPCESPVIPGLTLDAETDPAVHAGVEIEIEQQTPVRDERAEVVELNRRRSPRGAFTGGVVATNTTPGVDGRDRRVLIGRDLSAGGMRIEKTPGVRVGDRYCLAIYGPASHEPFVLHARVHRDDGERGFALAFVDVPRATARDLEKLVACLPDVESLEEGEADGMGAVISEVLSRTAAED